MVKPNGDPTFRPPPASNISNLKAIVDHDFFGATVTFNVNALTNTLTIILYRSFTSSIKAAVAVRNFPLLVQPNTYDDRDASIIGKQVWYWVQMANPDGLLTTIGPVTVVVQQGAPPHVVNWMEASADAGGAEFDAVKVHIVCEIFAGTDASGGIAVFVQNYQGNAASVLIFQDTTQVLSFFLKMTGETVTFFVAAVNATGTLSALSAGVNLKIGGVATKPCRLTGLAALEGNGFTQISFMASPEVSVTQYRLYRGAFGGVFAGAALVASIAPTDQFEYSIRDPVVNGHVSTWQWYVTAVSAKGESTGSDAILPITPWS